MSLLFRGTAPALVTPFTVDGAIDEGAFRRLIDRQIDGGVEGLVVLGTTGENATIWPDERRRLIAVALEHTNGRVPVIIGTGNNSTSESIVFSKEAAAAGADGSLLAPGQKPERLRLWCAQGYRVATRPARPLHARRSAS